MAGLAAPPTENGARMPTAGYSAHGMIACPRCGTQNAPESAACTLCGLAFSQNAPPPNQPARPNFGRTLVGQGPPVADPTPPNAAAATPLPIARQGTIIGMSPPPGLAPGATAEPSGTAVAPPAGFGKTVLGLAPAPPAPPEPSPEFAGAPDVPTERGPEPLTGGGLPPPTKTILGVARPGIAPLNPGVAKPEAPPEAFPSPPPPPPVYGGAAASELAITEVPKRRAPLLAGLVIGAAVLLLAGAGTALFLLRGPGPIEAKAGLDAQGREHVSLTCAGCPDGTLVRIGGQQATTRGGHAELPLASALKVGENHFDLDVTLAGKSHMNRVSLNVPLEYRVHGDTATLAQSPPRLSVQVEAIPGSTVSVENHPLSLAANGHASYEVDLTKELSGAETSVKRLERRVGYVITPPGGAAQHGEVLFQLGILPLTLDAPGDSIVIEGSTFVLSGRTLKGTSVEVAGRPIPVDAEGRFEQTMAVSAAGETAVAVRASAPEYAPRIVTFRVRRVNSLVEAGRAERAHSVTSYSTLVANLEEQRGKAVALDGNVIEIGSVAPSTLFLLDTKSGCTKPPCITKVVYGGRLRLTLGDRVSVFGPVRGVVDGPRAGSRVPEVAADFVVKGSR
jgi:hypothetical protein